MKRRSVDLRLQVEQHCSAGAAAFVPVSEPQDDEDVPMVLGMQHLHFADTDAAVDHSYEITARGLKTRGYEIGSQGISQTPPHRKALVSSSTSSESTAGSEAADHSKLVNFGDGIGKGASGSVSKALHLDTGDIFALKGIGVHIRAKRRQLVKELNTFASVDCPFIVNFHGAFYEQGTTLLVLEYMNRGSMQYILDSYGPMTEEVLQRIAAQVVRGLQHMHHRRQIHRDIKPSNILLNSQGQAKLADFGLVKELGTMTNANTFVGTQMYMSPERIQSEPYGFPSDIWSLGLTLHTCAAGKFPYSGSEKGFLHMFQTITKDPSPRLPRSKFSVGMRNFLSKCLAKNPSHRWSADLLVLHPWVKDVAVDGNYTWPWESPNTVEQDIQDLRSAVAALSNHVYKSKTYFGDKQVLKIAERLSACLNLPIGTVRKHLEGMHLSIAEST